MIFYFIKMPNHSYFLASLKRKISFSVWMLCLINFWVLREVQRGGSRLGIKNVNSISCLSNKWHVFISLKLLTYFKVFLICLLLWQVHRKCWKLCVVAFLLGLWLKKVSHKSESKTQVPKGCHQLHQYVTLWFMIQYL